MMDSVTSLNEVMILQINSKNFIIRLAVPWKNFQMYQTLATKCDHPAAQTTQRRKACYSRRLLMSTTTQYKFLQNFTEKNAPQLST